MPTIKKPALQKKSAPPAKSLKKHASPPPHGKHPHEKPDKPGKKHDEKQDDKPGKKHAGKHDSKGAGKHLRRAFEHLGRVEALQTLTQADSITTLVRLAQASIDHDVARPAADLLRAAEHLSFAAVAAQSKSSGSLSADLEEAVRHEFRKLLEHAEDHELAIGTTLDRLLRQSVEDARKAFEDGNFRRALELARAAESLASIHEHDAEDLDPATPQLSKSIGDQSGSRPGAKPGKRAPKR